MTRASPFLTALGLAGCISMGPGTVMRNRFDHTTAVAESWKGQMLLKLVKLRYGDTPVSLDVGQSISGYTVDTAFSASGTLFGTSGVIPRVLDTGVGLGAQGRYTDRPIRTSTPCRATCGASRPPAVLACACSGPTAARPSS